VKQPVLSVIRHQHILHKVYLNNPIIPLPKHQGKAAGGGPLGPPKAEEGIRIDLVNAHDPGKERAMQKHASPLAIFAALILLLVSGCSPNTGPAAGSSPSAPCPADLTPQECANFGPHLYTMVQTLVGGACLISGSSTTQIAYSVMYDFDFSSTQYWPLGNGDAPITQTAPNTYTTQWTDASNNDYQETLVFSDSGFTIDEASSQCSFHNQYTFQAPGTPGP
jgi:hypothetical protein